MSDDAPLSLESALSLMTVTPPTSDTSPGTDAGSKENDDNKNAAPDAPPTDTPPPAESADATETPPDQGSTDGDEEDPGDALPPIDPPPSWKAEEKSNWESLPRNVQEAIARREQDRTTELRNLQNQTAEQRKAAEAEVTRVKALATQMDGFLNEKVAALAREFPNIRSEQDVIALAQTDPAKYIELQAKLNAIGQAKATHEQAQQEVQRRQQQEHQEQLGRAKEALLVAFPTWKDDAVARKEITEIQDYAIKQGAPESAARASLDPVIYKLTQKAMLYDRAQEAAAKARVRTPPTTVKPGTQTASPKQTSKDTQRRAQWDKLTQTGDMEDAIGLLCA